MKASEAFLCQQQVEEEEANLDCLLCHVKEAGVKQELAKLAGSSINDEVVHTLIKRLLVRIDMLWNEKQQAK